MIRLDQRVLELKLFNSRNKAQEAIKNGFVSVNKIKTTKPGKLISKEASIKIKGKINPYVSRGGLKLATALNIFKIDLNNKIMLDIGSSTGGFTDVALRNKVKKVIAVDVGQDQMDVALRNNNKVELYEETDFREIDNKIVKDVEIATIDVSFISVTKLLNKIGNLNNLKEIICLIKPQFEVDEKIIKKHKGIVDDKQIHYEVLTKIINEFSNINFNIQALVISPIKGKKGNVEYLGYFQKLGKINEIKIKDIIKKEG